MVNRAKDKKCEWNEVGSEWVEMSSTKSAWNARGIILGKNERGTETEWDRNMWKYRLGETGIEVIDMD